MVDWQDETPDSKEMLKSLKVDLDKSEVFVFTPEGEAKSLRAGSTPVDFAYAVHTQVGNHCVGAKVNGAIVPLTYELKTGDRVEILTQKSAVPSRDWLNFVKTPSAKSKIRQYFSKKSRPDDLQAGKDILQAEMKKHGMGMSGTQVTRSIKELAGKLNFKNADELFIKIGNGKESVKNITNRLLKMMVDNSDKVETDVLKPKMQTGAEVTPKMITNVNTLTKKAARTDSGVVVKGINDVMVRLSRCCNPVPGDEIIGFVTRGRGVSIHRADCPNAIDLLKDKDRIIEVSWDSEKSKGNSYRVEIIVEARDRMGLLNDITNEISNLGANFTSFNAHARDDGSTRMNFMFVLSDITLASKLAESLKQINGVLAVYRAASSKDKQNSAETKLDFGKKEK